MTEAERDPLGATVRRQNWPRVRHVDAKGQSASSKDDSQVPTNKSEANLQKQIESR